MELSVLRYEEKGAVGIITMHHPPVNAFGVAFLDDFERVVQQLRSGGVRAAVLTSACPGFFSAGDDLRSLEEIDEALLDKLPRAHAALDGFEALPIPTVAAINGQALGGGLELALVCDFRFMGDASGRIGLPEVRLGMMPALGGTQRLPQLVGKSKAIEMMYKGLIITPEEAAEIGLVNKVFPQADIVDKSIDYAVRLAKQATGAIACIKRSINAGYRHGFTRGIEMEQQAFRENITAPDAREGIAAFLAGRKPVFSGKPASDPKEEPK